MLASLFCQSISAIKSIRHKTYLRSILISCEFHFWSTSPEVAFVYPSFLCVSLQSAIEHSHRYCTHDTSTNVFDLEVTNLTASKRKDIALNIAATFPAVFTPVIINSCKRWHRSGNQLLLQSRTGRSVSVGRLEVTCHRLLQLNSTVPCSHRTSHWWCCAAALHPGPFVDKWRTLSNSRALVHRSLKLWRSAPEGVCFKQQCKRSLMRRDLV